MLNYSIFSQLIVSVTVLMWLYVIFLMLGYYCISSPLKSAITPYLWMQLTCFLSCEWINTVTGWGDGIRLNLWPVRDSPEKKVSPSHLGHSDRRIKQHSSPPCTMCVFALPSLHMCARVHLPALNRCNQRLSSLKPVAMKCLHAPRTCVSTWVPACRLVKWVCQWENQSLIVTCSTLCSGRSRQLI